jgi:hypothetical protein
LVEKQWEAAAWGDAQDSLINPILGAWKRVNAPDSVNDRSSINHF